MGIRKITLENISEYKPSELILKAVEHINFVTGNGYKLSMTQWIGRRIDANENIVCCCCLGGACLLGFWEKIPGYDDIRTAYGYVGFTMDVIKGKPLTINENLVLSLFDDIRKSSAYSVYQKLMHLYGNKYTADSYVELELVLIRDWNPKYEFWGGKVLNEDGVQYLKDHVTGLGKLLEQKGF